jgi:hypothetical protein
MCTTSSRSLPMLVGPSLSSTVLQTMLTSKYTIKCFISLIRVLLKGFQFEPILQTILFLCLGWFYTLAQGFSNFMILPPPKVIHEVMWHKHVQSHTHKNHLLRSVKNAVLQTIAGPYQTVVTVGRNIPYLPEYKTNIFS